MKRHLKHTSKGTHWNKSFTSHHEKPWRDEKESYNERNKRNNIIDSFFIYRYVSSSYFFQLLLKKRSLKYIKKHKVKAKKYEIKYIKKKITLIFLPQISLLLLSQQGSRNFKCFIRQICTSCLLAIEILTLFLHRIQPFFSYFWQMKHPSI